jgi:hypothetical protein
MASMPARTAGHPVGHPVFRVVAGMHAVQGALILFAIVAVWLNYRHQVALSELTLTRLGWSPDNRGQGGFALLFPGAVTIILAPFAVMAAIAALQIWRRSRAAWMISTVGAGLLAGASALLFLVLLVGHPFNSFEGDWDLSASPDVKSQFDLVAREDSTHWHEWAMLSLPALGAMAISTLILQIRWYRRPTSTHWTS